jgi:hypothetical protein
VVRLLPVDLEAHLSGIRWNGHPPSLDTSLHVPCRRGGFSGCYSQQWSKKLVICHLFPCIDYIEPDERLLSLALELSVTLNPTAQSFLSSPLYLYKDKSTHPSSSVENLRRFLRRNPVPLYSPHRLVVRVVRVRTARRYHKPSRTFNTLTGASNDRKEGDLHIPEIYERPWMKLNTIHYSYKR